ncbi:MAG TPA: Uma2 family endonuclease [Gemmataceae bacterium]|nr:Uma2 family endonuclease [Gemmataceae bacterium]
MITVINEFNRVVSIPTWIVDLESFRRWVDADDFPEDGRIWYLKGEVWIDMSKEQIFTHLAVKREFFYVLTGLVKEADLGLFLPDGLLLSNGAADISGKPDATFVANASIQAKRVQLVEGWDGGFVEMEGSPDMVLEVISSSSVHKDTVVLRQAYWQAGIHEYWLVDARQEPIRFDILRRTTKGYAATRKQDGWLKSVVFGKSFQLSQRVNALGHPEYTLAVR